MAGPVRVGPAPVTPISQALAAATTLAPISAPPIGGPAIGGQPIGGAGLPGMSLGPTGLPADMSSFVPQQVAPAPLPNSTPLNQAGMGPATPQDTNPSDPISWVLDMLDRPARAVRDTIKAVGDTGMDLQTGKAGLHNIGDIATAPFRGLFSTNAADQQTFGQIFQNAAYRQAGILEHKTPDQARADAHKAGIDTGVNILSGIAGFAGDMATDPLSYLGGPEIKAIIGGAKGLVTGLKTAKDVGPEAAALAKEADKAAGGDQSAANLIDAVTGTAASDAARTAAEASTPLSADLAKPKPGTVDPITPQAQADVLTGNDAPPVPDVAPVISEKWTTSLQDHLTRTLADLAALQATDPATLAARARQTLSAKIDKLTGQRDKLLARKYPGVAPKDAPAETPVAPAAEAATPAPAVDSSASIGPSYEPATSTNQWGEPVRTVKADYTATDGTVYPMTYSETKRGGNLVAGTVRIGDPRVHLSDASPTGPNRRWDSIEERTQGHPAGLDFSNFQTGEKGHVIDDVGVVPELQRKGVASAMHSFAQRELGQQIAHSANLTGDGAEFAAGARAIPSAAAPAADAPLSATLSQEPTSLGDQFRPSGTAKNFVKAYDRMKAVSDAHGLTLLDAFTQAKQTKNMRTLFGDNFLAATQKYTNPERFARMLDETYRIVKDGGHLDNGDLETTLKGARPMIRALLTDAGLGGKKMAAIQEERAAFKARSTVAETATPESTIEKMRSPKSPRLQMVEGVADTDLQKLVKERSDALRDPNPGQDIRTETGAWTDGKGPGVSTAKYPDRMNTHNQSYDIIRASQMGQRLMEALDKGGGKGRSELLRGIVMGTPGRTGLLEGLTKVRDKWGYTHFLEDGIHAPVKMSAYQALLILGEGSMADQRIIDKLFFNGGTPVSKTNTLEAVAAAIHGASPDEIRAILSKDTKRARHGSQGNFLSRGKATGNVDHRRVAKGERLPKGHSKVENENYPGWFYIRQTADSLLNEATDLIVRRSADLRALEKTNAEAYAGRLVGESTELIDGAQKVTDLARITPELMADAILGIAEPEKVVEAVAAAAGGALSDSKKIATEVLDTTIPEVTKVDAKAKVASAAKVEKGDRKGARAAAQKGSDAAAADAQAAHEAEAAQATAEANAAEGLPPGTVTNDTEEVLAESAPQGPEYDLDRRATLGRGNGLAKELWNGDATDSRIKGRWNRTIQAVTSPINKAANTTVGGLGIDELHTGRLGVTRRLSREYGMLGHDFSVYTKQQMGNTTVGAVVLKEALRRVPSAPEHARPRAIVDQMLAHFMGTGVDGQGKMLAEPLLRSGVDPKYIWDLLQEKGIIPKGREYSQDIEEMLLANRSETGSFVGSVADWLVKGDPANGIDPIPIPDPNEFLQRMFTATSEFSMHVGIAQDLRNMGIRHGFLSETYKPGLVRLVGSKDSLFSHVLGEVYTDAETAFAVNRVADMLKPTRQMSSELSTILQAFDDLQQAWKYGETAIRPGTHLHNYVSDHIMTWLAEGGTGYRRAMINATKMLAANEKGGAMSVAEMMNGVMGITHDPNAFKGPDEVLFKGRFGQYTNHEANQLLSDAGLTASARNIQRTDSENLSQVGKGMERWYQSKAGKLVDKINELQENHVRMTHAAITLQKALDTGYVTTRWGKKVSIIGKDGQINRDVLKTALGERVRRFHPDPNMLTTFEKDGVRRAMPFYMWNRGAVPAILETAYLHPGRVLMFNKLSFNVGMALGVQGNNLADPYPNGAWPGFLLNQMQGPQANINGSLFTANPGIPTWDVANMFTDPNQITGSVSPLLSIPAEVATGTNWQTHEPISNWYDAIDAQIPGAATLATMTGYSPTNSLVSLLTGNGPQKTSLAAQGQQDPQQPLVSGLGYVGGINTQHVNKTSYQMAGVAQQQQRLLDIMTGKSPAFGH